MKTLLTVICFLLVIVSVGMSVKETTPIYQPVKEVIERPVIQERVVEKVIENPITIEKPAEREEKKEVKEEEKKDEKEKFVEKPAERIFRRPATVNLPKREMQIPEPIVVPTYNAVTVYRPNYRPVRSYNPAPIYRPAPIYIPRYREERKNYVGISGGRRGFYPRAYSWRNHR